MTSTLGRTRRVRHSRATSEAVHASTTGQDPNGADDPGELESLLGRSFPLPGDADKIREIFAASLADDRLGIPLPRNGERIRYTYPVAVLVAGKPAA